MSTIKHKDSPNILLRNESKSLIKQKPTKTSQYFVDGGNSLKSTITVAEPARPKGSLVKNIQKNTFFNI
jgi:hypothetical protein